MEGGSKVNINLLDVTTALTSKRNSIRGAVVDLIDLWSNRGSIVPLYSSF